MRAAAVRRTRSALFLAGAALAMAPFETVFTAPTSEPRPLEIYWIDVEGGAATLIVSPAGESLLIDAGFSGGRDAARIHDVATNAAGLTRIDRMLVTHFHRDHFGGVAELAQRMPVGELLERDLATAPAAEQAQAELLEAYRSAAVEKRTRVQAGPLALRQAPGTARLELEVLGANGEFPSRPGAAENARFCRVAIPRAPDASDNRNSVVTVLRFGDFRFFDGGDLTWNAEADLVCPRNLAGGPVDVFQIDHHGVDTSNNPALVRSLAPTVVVVNNGPSKGGEPGSFAAVQATPSVRAVYQLHRSLRFPHANTVAERILNESEECGARFVKLTVEPDGRRYWLWVPSTGHRQSYTVRAGAPEPKAAGRVEVVSREDERRVDVAIDGAPFTSYVWPESLMKPALWPIRSASGAEVTRGFPLAPRPGERSDHPHHVGLWFSYGAVNGVDFWNNSTARSKEEQARMGRTVHRKVLDAAGGDAGRLTVQADWLLPGDELALQETAAFVFRPLADGRLIARTTTLLARRAVSFDDNKEGLLGLRVARSLEQPAEEKAAVIGSDYRPAPAAPLDNTGVAGLYRSSEGKSGDAVWGTRGRWVALAGQVEGGQPVVVAILDHPGNPGAPTYWHARGYGLFAANPLGQREFSGGRERLGFALAAGQSAVFRYQVAVLSGAFSAARIEELYRAFTESSPTQ